MAKSTADGSLSDQLNILRDPASTEEEKRLALNKIPNFFWNGALSHDETSETLQIIISNVLDRNESSEELLRLGLYCVGVVFISTNASKTAEDKNLAIPLLKKFAENPASETLQQCALDAIGCLFYSQVEKTKEDVDLFLPFLRSIAVDRDLDAGVRNSAVGAISSLFGNYQTPQRRQDIDFILPDMLGIVRDGSNEEFLRHSALNAVMSVFNGQPQKFASDVSIALPVLLEAAGDSGLSAYLRENAIRAISSVFWSNAPKSAGDVSEVLPFLVGIAKDEGQEEILRRAALAAIQGVFSYSVPVATNDVDLSLPCVISALEDASLSDETRSSAIYATSMIFQSSAYKTELHFQLALPALAGIFGDRTQEEDFRARAIDAAGYVLRSENGRAPLSLVEPVIPALVGIAKDSSCGSGLRGSAAVSLGVVLSNYDMEDTSGIFSALATLARDRSIDEYTRQDVLGALGDAFYYRTRSQQEVDAVLPLLLEIVSDRNEPAGIRSAAVGAIGNIFYNQSAPKTGENARDCLQAAISFAMEEGAEENLVRMADWAVKNIISSKLIKNPDDMAAVYSWVGHAARTDYSPDFKLYALMDLTYLLYYGDAAEFGNALSFADSLRNDSRLEEQVRARAGGVVANACFMKPELFADYGLFNMDEKTAERMVAASPEWNTLGGERNDVVSLYLGASDFSRIYELSIGNPYKPVVKTLFEDANLTCFGYYPKEILQHQYDNREHLTGKQVLYVVNTKHNWNGATFGSFLSKDLLGKFDVRIVEPWSPDKNAEDNLVERTVELASRLGITSKYDDPLGPKINDISFDGHGWAGGVQFVVVAGPGLEGLQRALSKVGTQLGAEEAAGIERLGIGESADLGNGRFFVRKDQSGALMLYRRTSEEERLAKGNGASGLTDHDGSFDVTDIEMLKQLEPYISGGHLFSLPLSEAGKAKEEFAKSMKVDVSALSGADFSPLSSLSEGKSTHFSVSGGEYFAFVKNGILNVSSQGEGFYESCSTADEASGFLDVNIAETGAKYLHTKMWGAQNLAGGIEKIDFGQNPDGKWHIDGIKIWDTLSRCYDYCNTALLPLPEASVQESDGGVSVSWKAASEGNTLHYDVERSVDGGDFEKIGRVGRSGSNEYSLLDQQLPPGNKVLYRIKQVNHGLAGTEGADIYTYAFSEPMEIGTTITGTGSSEQTELSARFSLSQNYPNPFDSSTTIEYSLPADGKVTLRVYDILGQEVRTLAENEFQKAGNHRVPFESLGLASGPYIYEITAEKNRMAKKMMLIK